MCFFKQKIIFLSNKTFVTKLSVCEHTKKPIAGLTVSNARSFLNMKNQFNSLGSTAKDDTLQWKLQRRQKPEIILILNF